MVNNDYTHWEMYAIGGSADPTINSQGNRFAAPDARFSKEVKTHLLICIVGFRVKLSRMWLWFRSY